MTWWQRLLFRRRAERELDAELRDHLARLTTEYAETGEAPPDDARRQAALAFGGLDQIKEMCRDVRPARALEIFGRDVWYGLRVLKRSPSFTFVAIACLSLGVGVNTAVFSVSNAVLLKPLPYRQPEELVVVFKTSPQRNVNRTTFGPAEFLDWHGRLSSFTGLAAYQPWAPTSIRPFDDIVFDSLADRTFPMVWFACFAALAVMLSALGVHGVVSYALAQRRREFGIRLALGATPRRLLAQALRQSLLPTAAGCALGLAATVWLTRVLSSLAYGIDVRELLWLSAAAAVLPVIVALVSAYPSARRVASLNPTNVLRLG
jgi:FtsX-like permease family